MKVNIFRDLLKDFKSKGREDFMKKSNKTWLLPNQDIYVFSFCAYLVDTSSNFIRAFFFYEINFFFVK